MYKSKKFTMNKLPLRKNVAWDRFRNKYSRQFLYRDCCHAETSVSWQDDLPTFWQRQQGHNPIPLQECSSVVHEVCCEKKGKHLLHECRKYCAAMNYYCNGKKQQSKMLPPLLITISFGIKLIKLK